MQDPTEDPRSEDVPGHEIDHPGLTDDMARPPDHGESSYRGSGRLQGRRALITGGDSGIGRAVAISFAREGADVAISYLPEEQHDAEETRRWIEEAGRKAVLVPGDIQDEAWCAELVANSIDALGGLDVLVNNAAYQMSLDSSIESLTTDQLERTYRTNVFALFWITKAALPHLQPGATIVNSASIQASDPSPHLIDYASTKAAIVNITQNLGQALAERGIRVNAVAPGPIWTPLIPATLDEEKVEGFGGQTPLERVGQPAELAPAYVYLASDDSSYVTGEVLGVTGGRLL